MRSDLRALLKILGASFLLWVVLIGVLILPALGALTRDVKICLALGVFLVGALAIDRLFGPALSRRDRESAEPVTRNIDDDGDSTEPKKKAKGVVLLLIIAIIVVLGCGGVVGDFMLYARALAKGLG